VKRALLAVTVLGAALAAPVFAQQDFVRDTIVSRMKNSRDFTVKVAEAMPANDYDYKLTAPQMSFAGQMAHIGESFSYFMSVFTGQKPNPPKPGSMKKDDVVSYVRDSYDKAIDEVSKLTPEQIDKTYKTHDGSTTGLTTLIAMLEHAAHHRASAEMYLREKGITPPSYMD
jgi:uncharacterized damage-inducible protein DinB